MALRSAADAAVLAAIIADLEQEMVDTIAQAHAALRIERDDLAALRKECHELRKRLPPAPQETPRREQQQQAQGQQPCMQQLEG